MSDVKKKTELREPVIASVEPTSNVRITLQHDDGTEETLTWAEVHERYTSPGTVGDATEKAGES